MKKKRKTAELKGQGDPWLPEEEQFALLAYDEGEGLARDEIGVLLGRSGSSVNQRLVALQKDGRVVRPKQGGFFKDYHAEKGGSAVEKEAERQEEMDDLLEQIKVRLSSFVLLPPFLPQMLLLLSQPPSSSSSVCS